jgi:hypothetical protein
MLPLTRSQEIGIWLRRIAVGILALLAFGMWIVWMFQQSADYKLGVVDTSLKREEMRLVDVDRLFEEPITAVTEKEADELLNETLVGEFGTFTTDLDSFKIDIDHGKYVIPPLPSPVLETILIGVDSKRVIRAYVRTWH